MKLVNYKRKFFLKIKNKTDFDFSKNTTYGCGGLAKQVYYPENSLQAICVFEKIINNGLNYFVLGNGSNVLASDKFFDGVVISTKKLKGIYRVAKNKIYCLAGTTVSEILNYCKKRNLSGLEYLFKIPATIGGVAYMNGGAGGQYLENNVDSVCLYTGKLLNLNNNDCNFSYKQSTMRNINCIILGVNLLIEPNIDGKSEKLINFYSNRRKNLPNGKSCGCVFKNPPNFFAGELIEKCGLKGKSIGSASVSCQHANFIINGGNCSADVFALVNYVKQSVYEKFGINLEEEVIYIGDDFT